MPTNVQTLNNLLKINELLAATGTVLPDNWAAMNDGEKNNFLNQLSNQITQTGDVSKTINKNIINERAEMKQMQQTGVDSNVPKGTLNTLNTLNMSKTKVFNLKKAQQMDMQNNDLIPNDQVPAEDNNKFKDGSDVKEWLNSIGNANSAIDQLSKLINSNQVTIDQATNTSGETLGLIKDAVNSFFSTNDEQAKLESASYIFTNVLPDDMKIQNNSKNQINTQLETNVHPTVAKIIDDTTLLIKKIAEEQSKKDSKVFNLKKTAQHKTLENVITFGPDQVKIDPFTNQPISDWHLVERNKGFGLVIDDIHNINFEAIWRNNIMDKYYAPYRDKDGNWVGGYIENRFEVNKNIPSLNNMQLKPGEKRKPYIPEFSSTEARLESSRDKMNKERGYSPSENGKVFNWKEASKKKVNNFEKSSQVEGLKPLKLPGEKSLNTDSTFKCPTCKSVLKPSATNCPNCGYVGTPTREDPKISPDKPGRQNTDTLVQRGQMLPGHTPIYNRASSKFHSDAILFDGKNFIVYANKEKQIFDSFEDAESYKLSQNEVVNPIVTNTPQQSDNTPKEVIQNPQEADIIKRKKEKHNTAHGLAIDG